jgi:hypothetical protein
VQVAGCSTSSCTPDSMLAMTETGDFGMFMAGAIYGAFVCAVMLVPTAEMSVAERVRLAPVLLLVGLVVAAVGTRYEADSAYGFACAWLLFAVLLCVHWATSLVSREA